MKKLIAVIAGKEFWQDVPEFNKQLMAELREASKLLIDIREYDISDQIDAVHADLVSDEQPYTHEQVARALTIVLEAQVERMCSNLADSVSDYRTDDGKLFWQMVRR